MQGAWHSPNTSPTMVHGQVFHIITWQPPTRGPPLSATWGSCWVSFVGKPWRQQGCPESVDWCFAMNGHFFILQNNFNFGAYKKFNIDDKIVESSKKLYIDIKHQNPFILRTWFRVVNSVELFLVLWLTRTADLENWIKIRSPLTHQTLEAFIEAVTIEDW